MAEEIFGNYPFPPDRKRPIHIRGDLIKHFIYPAERPHFSDLNYLYVSTDKLTVGTWQLGPGRHLRSAGPARRRRGVLHPGRHADRAQPAAGRVHAGEEGRGAAAAHARLPQGPQLRARDHARPVRHRPEDLGRPDAADGLRGRQDEDVQGRGTTPSCRPSQSRPEWYRHGTTDDIGRWPVPGPECRKDPMLFYHITEDKKLINIHGVQYPMLVKFFVSNDLVHMGEFILPAGGTGSRASRTGLPPRRLRPVRGVGTDHRVPARHPGSLRRPAGGGDVHPRGHALPVDQLHHAARSRRSSPSRRAFEPRRARCVAALVAEGDGHVRTKGDP